MADLAKVKRNISKMIAQNAPENDIAQYVASEGTTPEELRAFRSTDSSSMNSQTSDSGAVVNSEKGDLGLDSGQVGLGTYLQDAGSQFVKGLAAGVPAIVTGPVALGNALGEKLAAAQMKYVNGATDEQIAQRQAEVAAENQNNGFSAFTNLPKAAAEATGIGEAQTTPGKFANTVGEMLPGSLIGPGGLARNAAMGVASGVASEAAGETAQKYAPDWERSARLVGAIAAGNVTAGSKAAAENAMLSDIQKSTPELAAAKNSAYEQAANTLGKQQVPLQDYAGLVRQANKLTGDAGVGGVADASTRARLGASMPVVEEMTTALRAAVKGDGPPPTFADLETWRQNLNSVVDRSIGNDGRMGADGYFAKQVIGKIDDMVGKSPYSDARAAVVTLRKVQTLDDAISKARNSENFSQALQSQFKKILNANVVRPIYSPAEIEQIRQVANGSFKGNVPGLLGKLGIGADYIAGQVGSQVGGVAGEAAGMIGSNLARSALRKTGAAINDSAGAAAAQRARDLTAMGNQGGIQDAVTAAGKVPMARRLVNSVGATQNADQQSATAPALKLPDGRTFWNPSWSQANALLQQGASWLQPQSAIAGATP